MYNPLGIPIERIDEKEGTITFWAIESNLLDKELPLIRILEICKSETVFILERDDEFNLKFIQSNPNYNTKIAKVNIQDFGSSSKFFIGFSWSRKSKNMIYVGSHEKDGLRSSESSEAPNIKYRVGKDGSIYQIGDAGVKVGSYRIKIGRQTVLEPVAREVFDFQLDKIKILIENCKKGDFLFESTLTQQVSVLLVTAFETYVRMRFIELEKEEKVANIEELYNRFIPKRYREQFREGITESATNEGKTELQVLVDRKTINFQDWESFKDAYNKGYDLIIGQIGISNDVLVDIQKILKWRHKIIHSKDDQTIINWEDVPPEKPLFTNKDLAERSLNTLARFINALHESTLKL